MSEVAQAPHSSPDGHIPQLRFPEFNVSWNEYKLGSITDVVDSLHTTPKDYVSSGFPMIRVVDVSNIELDLNKCLNVSEETYRQFTKKYQPKVGDVVLSRVGTCGASIMLRTKDNVCLGQNTVLLHPKINKDFYHILVKSNIFQVQVSRRVVGSTQKTLSLKDLKLFKLNIPAKPEQQKIAAFLAAVDNKIEQLSKKKALLGEYKKGLMQQIFSQAIRFKSDDGGDFPDWEEKKLGDVFEIKAGQSKSKHIKKDGKNIIVDMGGISSEPKLVAKKLTDYDDDFLTTNDLVMPKDDIGGGLIIGKVAEIPENNKYICGDHIYKLTVVNGNITFLKYAINSYQVNKSFRQKANGTAQIGLSRKEVENQLLSFPSLKEQTKIANFLSSIDSKIEQVGKQLNESKQFKKALLQQMFI